MKAKYYTTEAGEKAIVNFLVEMCPKTENNYSLGFKRYSALSKAKKLQMDVAVFKDGFGYTLEAHNEVKRRLAEMTEEQYKQFKLSK